VSAEGSEFDRWYELHTGQGDRRSVSGGVASRAWFHDLYEERGPVDRSEIDAAFREREGVIAKRAIASVIADVERTTGQRPVASVETKPALLISYWRVNGMLKQCCCLSSSPVDELDLFVITVRDMQDNIREDLNQGWPRCPSTNLGCIPVSPIRRRSGGVITATATQCRKSGCWRRRGSTETGRSKSTLLNRVHQTCCP